MYITNESNDERDRENVIEMEVGYVYGMSEKYMKGKNWDVEGGKACEERQAGKW